MCIRDRQQILLSFRGGTPLFNPKLVRWNNRAFRRIKAVIIYRWEEIRSNPPGFFSSLACYPAGFFMRWTIEQIWVFLADVEKAVHKGVQKPTLWVARAAWEVQPMLRTRPADLIANDMQHRTICSTERYARKKVLGRLDLDWLAKKPFFVCRSSTRLANIFWITNVIYEFI